MPSPYRHLFGPVHSRRFGRSLGVDLQAAGAKSCSLNCVFCQLGPTAAVTVERQADVAMADVLAELQDWRRRGGTADFVTLSGNGEPTLHPDFGKVLDWSRRENLRSLLLSNGTLFTLPEVRNAAANADVVKLSLHAWDQASFERIVRPHPALRFTEIVESYARFRSEYRGELAIEVFVVPGINDHPDDMARIATRLRKIGPDRIQLNHAVRAPADPEVRPVDANVLRRLSLLFRPPAELPSDVLPAAEAANLTDDELGAAVTALVCRHPASLPSLAATFGCDASRLRKLLRRLQEDGRISLKMRNRVPYAGSPQN